jgi:hypothetical protein
MFTSVHIIGFSWCLDFTPASTPIQICGDFGECLAELVLAAAEKPVSVLRSYIQNFSPPPVRI